jgi:hypothetical protein
MNTLCHLIVEGLRTAVLCKRLFIYILLIVEDLHWRGNGLFLLYSLCLLIVKRLHYRGAV